MLNKEALRNFLAKVEWQEIAILIVVIIILFIITKAVSGLSKLITKKFPTKRMTILGWVPLINFMVYFGGTIITFFIIFEPTQEVYLGLLVSGFLALGLAVKEIFQSIVAGVVLLLDKPFQVGDRITYLDNYGEIINIGLRSIKLLTLDEDIVTIPNCRFLSDTVSSSNAGELGMMATVDIYISPRTDIEKIKNILENIVIQQPHVEVRYKPKVVAKEILSISGIVSVEIKTKCIIKDARTEQTFKTNFLIAVYKAFKTENIAI